MTEQNKATTLSLSIGSMLEIKDYEPMEHLLDRDKFLGDQFFIVTDITEQKPFIKRRYLELYSQIDQKTYLDSFEYLEEMYKQNRLKVITDD